MRDEMALSSLSCDIEAKTWGGDSTEEMVQTDGATEAKAALEDVGLRERGPAMMDERGQVPDSEG